MNVHSDSQNSEYSIRERLIGIGEHSVRKSYYPQLQKQMEYLNDKSAALVNMLEDLEEARNELEDSEAKYRSIFENTGTASIIIDEDGVISLANAEWISLSGCSREENEGKSWTEYVASEDLERIEEWDRSISVNESQSPKRYEFRFIRRDGEIRNVIGSVSVIPGTNKRIASLIDITERKVAEEALHRLNRELRAISNCNQTLMRAEDEQTLLNDICHIICDEAGYRMVWVGFAENDDARTIRPIARAGAENGYLEQAGLTWADTELGRGPSGTAIRTGESDCIQDFATEPRAAPWRDSALQRGYRSSIVLPLKDENATTFGVLNIYSKEPNAFTPDEMRLLEELAGDLAFGIMVLRTRTERQQAEEKIAHLAAIVESSDDAIIGKSLDGRIVSWNKGAQRVYGYTADEILGKPIAILVPADKQSELSDIMQRLSRGEAVEHCESVRIRKDGQAIFVSLTISPIMDADGRIVGASTIARDVTERKHAEDTIRGLNEVLEGRLLALTQPVGNVSNIQLSDLFSIDELQKTQDAFALATGVASIITDTQGHPITKPSNFCRLCEHIIRKTEKGLLNCYRSDASLGQVHPHGSIMQRCLSGGLWDAGTSICIGDRHIANWLIGQILEEPVDEDAMLAYAAEIGADKDEFRKALAEVTRMPRKQFEKVADALYLIANQLSNLAIQNVQQARFITERKQAEETLRAHKEHLEELVKARTAELVSAKEASEAANRAKSVFLASMSHELRTPLNAVLGFSQLMQADPTLNEGQKENLEVINRSGAHLLGLINNVLEISRIEAGRITKDEIDCDLWNALETIKDMMRVRAKAKGLSFILERDPSLPRYVKADERKLKQVILNLAGNAVKFTQQGEIILRAKADSGGTILRFEVEDTGPGIDTKAISTLFESFAQGSHDQEGAGLGLFISRRLVEFMGGQIAVQSELDKGSIFSFDIPCESVTAAEIPSPKAHRVVSLAPGQRPPRILVTEDNLENRLLMTKTLRSKGFEVAEAVNGMEAVQLFAEHRPDLVLMDMRMPVMDGYEAIKTIRSTEQGKTTPIIAVTASAFEEDRQKILALGADDFIRKPVQDAELFEKIRLLLNITYIYLDQQVEGAAAITQMVLVEMVAQLPKDLTDELTHAMTALDLDGFKALLPKVRQSNPILAEQLGRLADGFRVTELAEAFPTTIVR